MYKLASTILFIHTAAWLQCGRKIHFFLFSFFFVLSQVKMRIQPWIEWGNRVRYVSFFNQSHHFRRGEQKREGAPPPAQKSNLPPPPSERFPGLIFFHGAIYFPPSRARQDIIQLLSLNCCCCCCRLLHCVSVINVTTSLLLSVVAFVICSYKLVSGKPPSCVVVVSERD